MVKGERNLSNVRSLINMIGISGEKWEREWGFDDLVVEGGGKVVIMSRFGTEVSLFVGETDYHTSGDMTEVMKAFIKLTDKKKWKKAAEIGIGVIEKDKDELMALALSGGLLNTALEGLALEEDKFYPVTDITLLGDEQFMLRLETLMQQEEFQQPVIVEL